MLVDCKPGTSAIRIHKWRSELRHAYITHIDNIPVHSLPEINTQLQRIRNDKRPDVKIGFSTIAKQSMHPQLGVPQLYHDQMNIIGKHLWDIAHDPSWQAMINEETIFLPPKKALHVLQSSLENDLAKTNSGPFFLNYLHGIKSLPLRKHEQRN